MGQGWVRWVRSQVGQESGGRKARGGGAPSGWGGAAWRAGCRSWPGPAPRGRRTWCGGAVVVGMWVEQVRWEVGGAGARPYNIQDSECFIAQTIESLGRRFCFKSDRISRSSMTGTGQRPYLQHCTDRFTSLVSCS